MEELKDQAPNEDAKKWENMAEETHKTLPINKELPGGYRVSSLPFKDKDEAYEEIKNIWQGEEGVTTYYDDGDWYIVRK